MQPYQSFRPPSYNRAFIGLKTIIIVTVAFFVLQNVFTVWFNAPVLETFGALSISNLRSGYIWTLFSYSLLHGDFFHILFNMLVIFFVGRMIESFVGPKRLLQIYFASVLLGGLTWIALNHSGKEILVGASAGGFGLLTFFCLTHPNQIITFLLFFVIPVNLKPKWILWGMLAIESFMLLFYEIPGRSLIASSAHLGGILAGFITYHFMMGEAFATIKKIKIEAPMWTKKSSAHKVYKPKFKVNITNKKNLKTEVDRILDKINSEGFGSLTQDEKNTLDRAKDVLKH